LGPFKCPYVPLKGSFGDLMARKSPQFPVGLTSGLKIRMAWWIARAPKKRLAARPPGPQGFQGEFQRAPRDLVHTLTRAGRPCQFSG
jgi:hypothetical protein